MTRPFELYLLTILALANAGLLAVMAWRLAT